MILSFRTQHPKTKQPLKFVERIFSGVKCHTIREKQRPIGQVIHFATGVRTKNYHQFASGAVKRCDPIKIKPQDETVCISEFIEGLGWYKRWLNPADITQLAINDGFDAVEDFWKWFDKPFSGFIIHFDKPIAL